MAIQQRDTLRDLSSHKMLTQVLQQLLSWRSGLGSSLGSSSVRSPLIAGRSGHARMIAGEGGREQV